MSDTGHSMTEKKLAALEKRISSVYGAAAEELQKTIDAYFGSFTKRDEEMKKLIGTVQNGREWTQADYTQWRLAQIGRGERFEDLRDKLAERMTRANEVAVAYVNDATPGIYSLNRNYAAYTIEQVAGDVGFTLWDEQTVKRLIVEQPKLMPYYPEKKAVDRGIDLAYGKKQIAASVTSGILQGKSIKGLADDLQTRITTMNRNSAIRTARTAVTGAQNAGRMDSYTAAQKMGIQLQKEWIATLDSRTRHSHAMLDGEKVDTDAVFSNGCRFPGDPMGAPEEVYNCRCTLIAQIKEVDTSNAKRRARDPVTGESEVIGDMSYQDWRTYKQRQHGKEAIETARKKIEREASDREQYAEYKAILGKNVPESFTAFQELKYNNPDKWARLKTMKRQTVFVENAPCVTTPKKFTEFFLKPGAKHADDFFGVGYTQDNPMQLRYDMARQFDWDKAMNLSMDSDGKQRFKMYMNLGANEKKRFRTAWIMDEAGSKPRIITAFREDKSDDSGI